MTDKVVMTNKETIHRVLSSLLKNDNTVGKMCYNQALQDAQVALDSLPEEPVSEDFEQALAKEWQSYIDRGAATVDALEGNTQELAFAKGFYRGAKWQSNQGVTKEAVIGMATEEISINISQATLDALRLCAGDKVIIQIRKKED